MTAPTDVRTSSTRWPRSRHSPDGTNIPVELAETRALDRGIVIPTYRPSGQGVSREACTTFVD